MRTVLVTGSAGFIGFHLSTLLLQEGFRVVGFDAMTDYYDPALKRRRHSMLQQIPISPRMRTDLEDIERLQAACPGRARRHRASRRPGGCPLSLENPRAYVKSTLSALSMCSNALARSKSRTC